MEQEIIMKIYTHLSKKKKPETQISKGYHFTLWVTMSHFHVHVSRTLHWHHYDHSRINTTFAVSIAKKTSVFY